MSEVRLRALDQLRKNALTNGKSAARPEKISAIFAENVFGLTAMKEYLPEQAFQAVVDASVKNHKIDRVTAEAIAKGMIKWAMDKGATHFTHWFQPLTGSTAEKHDAFFKPAFRADARGIESLTAGELLQREPDASSFPNGGLRGTHEARGYTIWDPTSPAFILEIETGHTLYIPSVFISYTGESLDTKGPLLKSIEALNQAAKAVCHYFDDSVQSVYPTLGWEQEYFVIDENLFLARPDLMLTGRTLFGHAPAKGQEKSDHYFGVIPERVQMFMNDFERECLRLGVPILTRHNEVAPAQYECAPMFEEVNKSVDHNLLAMNVMRRVAKKHHLTVLMHEKPFAGLNGSGKHNNWSLSTDSGQNLLSPGDVASHNLQFLTFFINVIAAIDRFPTELRAAISGAGNDHRLGANEAPPAIVSVFTGSHLEEVLNNFIAKGLDAAHSEMDKHYDTKTPRIPSAELDNTDRNRTSPFPFTGNKFEFRAVGSSHNCSFVMTTLNAAVADQLRKFHSEVEAAIKGGKSQEDALVQVLQETAKASLKTVFNGDGYADAWAEEAAKRGLPNIKSTPEALKSLQTPRAKKLFADSKVLSEAELEARVTVLNEYFAMDLNTEAQIMLELVQTHVVPAALAQLQDLGTAYDSLDEMDLEEEANEVKAIAQEIGGYLRSIRALVKEIEPLRAQAMGEGGHGLENPAHAAEVFANDVRPRLQQLREAADALEWLVDDEHWKLPKYRELLFVH